MVDCNTVLVISLIFTLSFIVINLNALNFGINIYASSTNSQEWQNSFKLEDCDLASNGANSYFILEPGYQLILEGQEDGADIQLKITVLDETKIVNGTEARVVEERETEGENGREREKWKFFKIQTLVRRRSGQINYILKI